MCSGCNARKSRAALADMDFRTYAAKLSQQYNAPTQRELHRLGDLKAEREEQRKAYEEFVCLDTEE